VSITNNQGTLPQRAINITVLITVLFWFPLTVFAATSTLNDYNPYNVNIPDNGSSVNSDLALSGAPSGAPITNVKVYYEIRHTYIGDLKVWLTTYYDGAWHDFVLKDREGGSADNIIETRDNLTTWNGASPNQTWYLVVQDMASGDIGYIDFFELWVTYFVNDLPNTPSSEDPSNGATGVSINKDLDWSCSDPNGDTLYYTVYFEKNNSSPDNVIKSDATGSSADPGTLDYSEHYYWQVKADDHKGGVTWSPVWDFYTEPTPVVDADITGVSFDRSQVKRGVQTITATVTLHNTGNQTWTFYVGGSSIKTGDTTWYDWSPSRATKSLTPDQSGTVQLTWSTPADAPLGMYGFFSKTFKYSTGDEFVDDDWRDGAFEVVESGFDASVSSSTFGSTYYQSGDTVMGSFELQNNSADTFTNLTLHVHLVKVADGTCTLGTDYGPFDIIGYETHATPSLSIWLVPESLDSGAYLPEVIIVSASGSILASFSPETTDGTIPVIGIGNFPFLNNLIVKSQYHFSSSDSSSVGSVLDSFLDAGFHNLSVSVKLDDGEGDWEALAPTPGDVLFSSANALPSAQNPLDYDLYAALQHESGTRNMTISPWIPTFYDHAALADNPSWELWPDLNEEDFIDACLEDVRNYEQSIILDAIANTYTPPLTLYIDHFRFTQMLLQHPLAGKECIQNFVREVSDNLPPTTRLAGYMFLPSDTLWSGQDYELLEPYLEQFSPMLYWQTWAKPGSREAVFGVVREYIETKIEEIRSIHGQNFIDTRVLPALSMGFGVDLSDESTVDLNHIEWKIAQLEVLGALADNGVCAYDMFYWQKWFYYVYQSDQSKGRWVDWARYLADAGIDDMPPSPNPMTWATQPYATGQTSIRMVATTASDVNGVVEYYFDETSGNPGASDSGWQDSPTYEDTGLESGTMYTYRVRARDKSPNQNTTDWSSSESATTGSATDTIPPDPSPMTWATQPYTASSTSISMVATTATDSESPPVSYFFDFVSSPTGGSGGSDSGWQSYMSYTDTGLQPNHQYGYRVKARDSASTPNETDPSNPVVYEYTLANTPGASSFSDITQTSIRANWTANGNRSGTEYYCENTTKGTNSGWTTNTYWDSTGLTGGTSYTFRVKARNGDGTQTGWANLGSQSTSTHSDTTPPTPNPMTWSTKPPYATGQTSIRMVATTASDVSGVEYYFQETSGNPGGNDSGWQASPEYENTGLNPGTAYSYRVKARDKCPNQNETAYSILRSATTQTSAVTRIAVVNPDTYRILKMGALNDSGNFYSIASGSIADGEDFTDPADWTGVGEQQDFISTILTNAGYEVDQFEASVLPSISNADYQVVIVQDPLRTNVRSFSKESEHNLPDLLEYTTDATFLAKLEAYFDSGGQVIFIGDAVRLLEDGPGRLNWGKSVIDRSVFNNPSQDDPRLADHWLFIRGNPFCGIDRNGSGQYLAHLSTLVNSGTVLSDITLYNGNDLPWSSCWSDTFYYPEDGTSLLSVDVTGTGEYVLSGATCNPPVYNDTVNETLLHLIGYTHHNGKKVFYIGSDSFFDYHYVNHEGAWHAGEYHSIQCSVTEAGKEAIVRLVQNATERKTKAMPWLQLLLFDE
jgi:subtilisin-like proprotein convertase family protein